MPAMTEPETMDELWPALKRMSRDLRQASSNLTRDQVRYAVDLYYQIQRLRIAAAAQTRDTTEPARLLTWIGESMGVVEGQIKNAMGAFAASYTVGQWLQSITGIGPVISAGLLAHLDIRRAPTVGHFWNFAGLNPDVRWEKKTKRPWNADLKTLVVFKLGECFVKVQNNENDFYGKLYRKRKDLELVRNERGEFAGAAAGILEAKKFRGETIARAAYEAGKLPPAHIHARARRWAVKLFLSHLHEVMYRDYYQQAPPQPFVFVHREGHNDFIPVPNWPMPVASGKWLRELLGSEQPCAED